ncbi:S8 family serine peptidase [Actinoallomurus spadix]|uniref:Peptidase S8/S53 domain-containing protein n=1 Tax=Actinoallomurus spadix TaxID=79912 RepID=A0ABN0W7P2_9ACTN|nr:S8 family serine peptidase [Actinoallomurus spadix]MCO5990664.1 S8 family serine peptidase [Actinoallomurus spadix]
MTLPWHRPATEHFPGVPAFGVPTSQVPLQTLPVVHLEDVTPDWAWGGADGGGIRVCVVDSGVDGTHPQVAPVDEAMTVVFGEDGDPSVVPTEPMDTAGHGTACAGIVRSMAPAVSLSSMRVLTDSIAGTGRALLAGLEWAIDAGFDVINLSLATRKPEFVPALHELADRAYFRRSVLVVSAHNMPVPSYPWPFASVISVASHDQGDPFLHYYNPSPPVEFYANGVGVPVAWPGGGRTRSSGNSFAAPHITGLCALILSKHRWLTPFQLRAVLYQTAKNVIGVDHAAAELLAPGHPHGPDRVAH